MLSLTGTVYFICCWATHMPVTACVHSTIINSLLPVITQPNVQGWCSEWAAAQHVYRCMSDVCACVTQPGGGGTRHHHTALHRGGPHSGDGPPLFYKQRLYDLHWGRVGVSSVTDDTVCSLLCHLTCSEITQKSLFGTSTQWNYQQSVCVVSVWVCSKPDCVFTRPQSLFLPTPDDFISALWSTEQLRSSQHLVRDTDFLSSPGLDNSDDITGVINHTFRGWVVFALSKLINWFKQN